MQFIRSVPRGMLAALAAAVVLVVVGVLVVTVGLGASGGSGPDPASLPPAAVKVIGLHHGKPAYGKKLRLRVSNGVLSAVAVDQRGTGRLAGRLNKTRTRWHSDSVIPPSTRLVLQVTYVDLAHRTASRRMHLRTKPAAHHFNAWLSPGRGTVGIGQPVVVNFDRYVPPRKRAAVQAGLAVTTSPKVVGAWHWMSGESVHWRPPHYWKPGTKVRVSSFLQDLRIGHNVWGPAGRHSTSFKIGASHISEADQTAHQMRVYDNGKLIRTFPISTGRTQYPTMDGVHIALDKSQVVQMDSATVGIPKGSPGYYNETVYWDVRISNGGEFVHAAPWSVADQGFTNVSHGCVNLSTTNAQWFYNWSRVGDVVDVYNGVRPPETGDPGTADWNMTWKQWLAGDAAASKAAKHRHPSMPRTGEPGFGPPPHHAKHHAKQAKHHASHASGSGG